ncbi:apoptosis regulator Bcl-2 [Tachysurus fulvidraco]|uniref:apoptosis regulator Bcl-2 n=1 Tax=Tachysurus fulvidraco TaxID=1234273 RepID=UPI000F50B033|nr:apoptosis regulator Bcl-2 [Tachysurus fulvidraco]
MANGNLYENRRIVEKYLNHKLSKNGHAREFHRCHASSPDEQERAHRVTLHTALREAGDELESLYRPDFAEMTKRLRETPVGAEQRRFAAVADELFRDGINWGRVVAFFEFGAMVCVQCAPDAERSACAENVARWMAEYLNGPLNGWIQENGGWDAFVELYMRRKDSLFSSSWPSLTTSVFSLAVLGAVGLTIGAYLTQK